MKLKHFVLSLSAFLGLTLAKSAYAVCPVCIVAVGAGLGLSRWFGVDDLISAVWIGGLLLAITIWTINWVKTRQWNFKYSTIVITASYYLLVVGPMFYYGIIGIPQNTFLGVDKIILGMIFGTFVFLAGAQLNNFLKTKNQGKVYFPYQKVVLPFLALTIISLIIWTII